MSEINPILNNPYEEEFKSRAHTAGARGDKQLTLEDTPPVFIVVCNNTGVSREVYKFIAGYEFEQDGETHAISGRYDLFSNYDPHSRVAISKPPTLLIDSDALENSGQIDEENLKHLRKDDLVEGRKPHLHVAAEKSEYIRARAFDDRYYRDLILEYLKKFQTGTKSEFLDLLAPKLSDLMTEKQKVIKVGKLLQALKKQ